MGKKHSFIKGTCYKVRFYDHCIGQAKKMTCEVVGWCIQDDKEHVVLTAWVVDTDDEEIKKGNVEPVSLIKSCILSKRKLF